MKFTLISISVPLIMALSLVEAAPVPAPRIWSVGVHWTKHSQSAVSAGKGKGVDVWECVREHDSTPGTQPPNAVYWRHVGRR
ncbi:hypothetical protein D9611_007246 [Ephemerocybe angulata]|uniref:Uncharacterized protein n=2 Tax=Ephemerocybe angulata TaxID=980116 RepID=A0A8H5B149_9AGAR|nr:hypothetical protein D9611_007246 [Tulosesus angulatus]